MKSTSEKYWNDIPTGKKNALTYAELCELWQCNERTARDILHQLSGYDNGDDYILIRSSGCKGFYKTDNPAEIQAYKRECISRGRRTFAPVKKINRVLNANVEQYTITNNLRVVRESRGMKQGQVCNLIQQQTQNNVFDKPLLSKMENNVILPTPYQLNLLAQIYDVEPSTLLNYEFMLIDA